MTRSRIVRWSALRRWLPGSEGLPESPFASVLLADVLTRREDRVSAEEFAAFSPITIRFGGAIVPRERDKPFAGSMWSAQPGDLVFSKIDVRNGAIGMLPDALGPAVVTGEYPIYVPDPDAVDASFLALLLRTEPFQELLRATASGTSGRKRVHPTQFETLEVPLPEPEEQRRLAAAHATATAAAAAQQREADRLEAQAVTAFEAALGLAPPPDLPRQRSRIARFAEMDRWSHEGALHTARAGEYQLESDHEIVSLEDVAEVSYGISKTPSNRPGTSARPYLRVANVQMNSLDLRKIKYIDVPDSEMERYRLLNKDILICEGNSIDLVGRGCMWHDEIPDCVHQNHIIKVRSVDQEEADPDFVLACINSSLGQAYFRSKAKRTTNLASINSTEVKEFSFPLPQDVAVQAELAGHLNLGLNEAEQARASAQSTRAQADAAFAEAVFG